MTTQRRLALAWAVVVCLLLGHNAWLWLGQRIVPDTDILALLPAGERDPVLQQSFTHMVDSAQQRVVVLVGAAEWANATRAADAFQAVLQPQATLLRADAAADAAQASWLAGLQPHASVLVAADGERALRTQAAGYWTENALARLYSAFSGPKLGAFRDDPFGLFAGWVQERAGETPVRPRDGRLFVAGEGRQYVLLTYTLNAPAFSLAAQRRVVPLLDAAAAAARRAHPGVEVIQAGVVLHAAAAGRQAAGEVETIGIGSLAGIVLLTWLTFRSVKPIGLILLAIGVGFLGALSVCWLLFGRIHLLTLVFGASLIGVAQDYGLYFLCHRLGADPRLGSPALLRRLLSGLGLTLLAAVIGYMGLALTPFPGLRHMAVFSALGLVFAWLTVVCWFPLLIGPATLRQRWIARRYQALVVRWPRVSARPATLALLAGLALAAAAGCARLGVDDDIRSLQSSPPQLVRDQIKLGKLLDAPTPVQYYLVRGASAEQVLQREEALRQRLDRLVAQGRIKGYQALSNWVPSQRTQAARRALVDAKLLGEGGPLVALAKAIGEDDAWVAAERAHLRAQAEPMTPDAFLRTPASEPWRHLWIGEVDGVHASIVALRGMPYAAIPQLARTADGLAGVEWVDKVGGISSVLGRYRAYMGVVVLGAYVLVWLALVPRYRKRSWRVLAPTAAASVLTLALLGLAGQHLQLFHVLALMLLLGVGVDYGIFMQEAAHDATRRAAAAPWLAVGLSAACTLLSFGLLALSGTPALRAFGTTMLLGTALVWFAAPCFTIKNENEDHHDTPVAP